MEIEKVEDELNDTGDSKVADKVTLKHGDKLDYDETSSVHTEDRIQKSVSKYTPYTDTWWITYTDKEAWGRMLSTMLPKEDIFPAQVAFF